MAEWSKALDLGSSLSGGVGSNPTAISFCALKGVIWRYIIKHILYTITYSLNGTGPVFSTAY